MSHHNILHSPTIHDVAKMANTSKTTVSRYLNGGRVKKKTAQALIQAIQELNYYPNVNARRLAAHKTMNIAVVVDNIDHHFNATMLGAIDSVVNSDGYHCTFFSRHAKSKSEREYLNLLYEGQADGIILVSFRLREHEDIEAIGHSLPIVLIGEGPNDSIYSVDVDNYSGTYDLVEYLYGLGHRHIAYISGLDFINATNLRLKGFFEASNDFGITVRQDWIVASDWTYEGGRAAMNTLLEPERKGFTAILASSDEAAIGALKALQEKGYSVPGDFSITGFDDTAVSKWTQPSLTTINQPFPQMGKKAGEIMKALLLNKDIPTQKRTLLKPQIVIRDSCSSIHK